MFFEKSKRSVILPLWSFGKVTASYVFSFEILAALKMYG